MSDFNARHTRRRFQGSIGAGRAAKHQPPRRQEWASMTPAEILGRYRPGKADPLLVLDVLLELFNSLHTALEKTVSHKTRQERADFLRRFFRDLKLKAKFTTVPDPRNLGDRHIRAMIKVWQQEQFAPATIQTYLSFLRGLALWLGKPGFIRTPAHYDPAFHPDPPGRADTGRIPAPRIRSARQELDGGGHRHRCANRADQRL